MYLCVRLRGIFLELQHKDYKCFESQTQKLCKWLSFHLMPGWAFIAVYKDCFKCFFSGRYMKYYHKLLDKKNWENTKFFGCVFIRQILVTKKLYNILLWQYLSLQKIVILLRKLSRHIWKYLRNLIISEKREIYISLYKFKQMGQEVNFNKNIVLGYCCWKSEFIYKRIDF